MVQSTDATTYWSTTAGNNTAAVPNGAPEGWKPSEVNNWGREVMAAVQTWYEDAEWIDFGHTLTFVDGTNFDTAAGDGDTTAIYHANRRIRCSVTAGTIYGTISSSAHTTQTRVTVTWDSGALDSGLSKASVGINSANNPSVQSFAATTRMLFQQTAAPTGWTKDTTAAINDIALRLTTGTVTNSTGNDAFSTVFGSSINTGSTTLTAAQSGLPSHTHGGIATDSGVDSENSPGQSIFAGTGGTTSATGGTSASSGHTHTMTMNLDYYEAIIASKD